ncbi:uncharacterized protein LOC132608342 [Lycium barbarum]|uniref:uncharacterized protein LOC132608342 n=1 Tax=Lycium barbarum TaxID=112863 RepID=UPI00293E66E0|nr:uncharacterized protein LOC132608342 [Lycium barbarum]
MSLVSSVFDGNGYGGWKRGILIALSAKNKVGFIDNSISQPSVTSDDFKGWSRCNDMVISWLLYSLSREIAESVIYSKTAKEIWTELEERFGQTNGPQLYQLQKKVGELVQANSGIAGYYTKLKRLWDELDSLDITQHCSSYSSARSSLLLLSPPHSVNHAYSLLIRDEKQKEVQVSHQPAKSAFLASKQFHHGQSSYGGQSYNQKFRQDRRFISEGKKLGSGLFCTDCKKTNHNVGRCYRIIGFPADFKFTKSKKYSGEAKSNAVYPIIENQPPDQGEQPMTQNQYHTLY